MEDKNIFMVCNCLNQSACTELPRGFYLRTCRPEELDLWKGFPFDSPVEKAAQHHYMTAYFQRTYAAKEALFYERCLFICDEKDIPVATGFIWEQHGQYTTVHWIKVKPEYEGLGLGRALLSALLKGLAKDRFPVYLHTQQGSFRAIKLYTDFGFSIITAPKEIDGRVNEYQAALPELAADMSAETFAALTFCDCTLER